MKYHLTILFIAVCALNSLSAQHCTNDARFSEVPVFSDTQIDSSMNVVYAVANNSRGQSQTLHLDVYSPRRNLDTLLLRPFILLIHGGGFISGDKEGFDSEAREFARRGFVAASIEYRLGHNCATYALSYDMAVYRAMQDANAAMRYVVSNATAMRIDTSWLFIGGSSAGAVTSLGLVYMSQAEWAQLKPEVVPALGGLKTSGNTLVNNFSIKGVYNNWGAVPKDQIQRDEMVPIISFHGDADPTVDIDSAYGGSCVNPPFLYGSRPLHAVLTNAGVCSNASVVIGGGHGVYRGTSGIVFRVTKACCFFKSLFCNTCSSVITTDSIPADCAQTSGTIDRLNRDAMPHRPNFSALQVIPNPFDRHIIVTRLHGRESFQLFNQRGQIIYSGTAIQTHDFSMLQKGIYLLKISTRGAIYTLKVVKK